MTKDQDTRTGQCLCGAVAVSGMLPGDGVQLCHCAQCQRWTGGGALAVVRVKDVTISGEDHISTFHASDHGERAFCRQCGTTLYWKLQGRGVAFLPVGLLDDQSGLRVREEIFTDRRACWMVPFEGAAQHDEAEMNAQLEEFLGKS